MRRLVFQYVNIMAFSAALTIAVDTVREARAYDNTRVCLSTITAVNWDRPVWTWNGTTGTWVYTDNWQVHFTCSQANSPACEVCTKTLFWVSTGDQTGPWNLLNTAYTDSGVVACNAQYVITPTTTFPATGVIVTGTWYKVEMGYAEFDPTLNDCQHQNFRLGHTDIFSPDPAP
jgi:hypothetical protein